MSLARTPAAEAMDAPGLDPRAHEHALAGLARLNRWSLVARLLWPEVRRAALAGAAPLELLDVACGAGDVPLALALRARAAGLALRITALDRSATALAHAARRARAAGIELHARQADALAPAGLPAQADVVTCSLFLHHLDPDAATHLLRVAAAATRRRLLVCDLRRTHAGLCLAAAASRLATRSDVVHADATASVRNAWTPAEARALAARAGLHGARVRHAFPQRWLLAWSPP